MQDDNKNFLGGLVVGGVLGVVLGLMIAPESGEKTRRKIKDKLGGLKDYLSGEIVAVTRKVKNRIGGKKSKKIKKSK